MKFGSVCENVGIAWSFTATSRTPLTAQVENFIANHWAIFRSATIPVTEDNRTDRRIQAFDDPAALLSRALLIQLKVPLSVVQDMRLGPVYAGIRRRVIDWRQMLDSRARHSTNRELTANAERAARSPVNLHPDSMHTSVAPPPSPSHLSRSMSQVLNYEPINRLFDLIEDKKLRLVDLFHTLDSDRSGYIDGAELGMALRKLDFPTTEDQLVRHISSCLNMFGPCKHTSNATSKQPLSLSCLWRHQDSERVL
eukprot:SAG31_NODE_2273_length_6037_cov_11.461862_3_plen_253_part_00